MPRTKLIFRPEDYEGILPEGREAEADALFQHLVSFAGKPEVPGASAGFAIIAREPKLALQLLNVSDFMTKECTWTTVRADLRQLAIQTLNLHFGCDFNYQSHLSSAARDGISAELQACIPLWETSTIFNEEQRLVIEFTLAACKGEVTDELYARAVEWFGDQGALEFTVAVAWWGFWAILVQAIEPVHDFGYSNAPGGK